MTHLRTISVRKASVSEKGIDTGDIFLQVWFTVFTFIIKGAFTDKG